MRLLLLSIPLVAALAGSRPLTPAEQAGREIYWRGAGVTALLNRGETELPGEGFACAGCHGAEGEGGLEAGLRVPPIAWSTLAAATRQRPAYRAAHFERALLAGFDPAGRQLSASMPLYRLTRDQSAALAAYLQVVGTDLDAAPGVSDQHIRFGAVLPLTGPLAERGQLIQAAVEAHFALANAAGGIFGRRLTLAVADSGSDPHAAALRMAQEGIFAMVASLDTPGLPGVKDLVAGTAGLVGPLSSRDEVAAGQAAGVYPVVPSVALQAQVLAARLLRDGQPVYVSAGDRAYASASAAFTAELSAAGVKTVSAPQRDGWAVYFGPASGWSAFRATVPAGVRTATVAMMMPGAPLPDLLASPFPPDRFAPLRQALGDARSRSPLAAWAWASAGVALEACRRSGRRLTPRRFRDALESLRDFPTDASVPVTYTRDRRAGARGAYLIEFNAISQTPVRTEYAVAPQSLFPTR